MIHLITKLLFCPVEFVFASTITTMARPENASVRRGTNGPNTIKTLKKPFSCHKNNLTRAHSPTTEKWRR
jgi:hypothetical protein